MATIPARPLRHSAPEKSATYRPQLRHPQTSEDATMARTPSPVSSPLKADQQFVAEHGRTLLPSSHTEPAASRHLSRPRSPPIVANRALAELYRFLAVAYVVTLKTAAWKRTCGQTVHERRHHHLLAVTPMAGQFENLFSPFKDPERRVALIVMTWNPVHPNRWVIRTTEKGYDDAIILNPKSSPPA